MKNSITGILICFLLGIGQALAQGGGQVDVINVDNLSYKKIDGRKVRILVGNVAFQKDSMVFNCDSAIQYIDDELIYAYNNVRFNQGDTLKLTGDELVYDDKKEFVEIKGETVVMTDSKMNLRTTALYYDMMNKVAYYVDSAYITDAQNVLWSQKGYYYTESKNMFFKDRVRLKNPDYDVKTDTLGYNVASENSMFKGPSHINTKDGDYIYCENGVFESKGNEVRLGKNSFLRSGSQFLYGDSLYYNSNTQKGFAYKYARLLDTTKSFEISGKYAEYDRKDEAYMVTDSLLMVQYEKSDTVYLTSDTLRLFNDSTKTKRIALAYRNVRIFSGGYQAVCDSMAYHTSDSMVEYYGRPVFWMDSFQVSSQFIKMFMKNGDVDRIKLDANALLGQKHDHGMFDQIGGDSMTAHFRKGRIKNLDVHSTSKAIYYLLEGDSALVGVNEVESNRAQIRFKDNSIDRLAFIQESSSYVTPAGSVSPFSLRLSGFLWRGNERPVDPLDLFRVVEVTKELESPEEGESDESTEGDDTTTIEETSEIEVSTGEDEKTKEE